LHPISKNDKNAGVVNGAVGINKAQIPDVHGKITIFPFFSPLSPDPRKVCEMSVPCLPGIEKPVETTTPGRRLSLESDVSGSLTERGAFGGCRNHPIIL
jgi:hypothetical protein